MRFIIVILLAVVLTGCTYEKYPLHQKLEVHFDRAADLHDQFWKISVENGEVDSLELSPEEFRKEAAVFLKAFPKVDDIEGLAEEQDHKYQGLRKFLKYDLDAPKGQEAEVFLLFKIENKTREVLQSASYTVMSDKDDVNPLIRLVAEITSNSFNVSKDGKYYTVSWE